MGIMLRAVMAKTPFEKFQLRIGHQIRLSRLEIVHGFWLPWVLEGR